MGKQTARRVRPGDFPEPPTAEELRRLEVEIQKKAVDDAEMNLANLQLKLKDEINRLVPKCSECGGTDIRIKISTHLAREWNGIIGPGSSGPIYSTHVEFLYCECCGATYYNSGVAKLEELMREIKEADDELSRLRNPHMC